MISILIKRKLKDVILSAVINNSDKYKKKVKELLYDNCVCGDNYVHEICETIRREYLDDCANEVFNIIREISPDVAFKIQLVLTSPKMCGYDICIENGFLAGTTFALCYYILTGKKASSRDCIILNHWHSKVMDEALLEIENK